MDNKRKQASTSVTKEGRTYSTSRDLGGLMSDPQKRKTAKPEGVSNRSSMYSRSAANKLAGLSKHDYQEKKTQNYDMKRDASGPCDSKGLLRIPSLTTPGTAHWIGRPSYPQYGLFNGSSFTLCFCGSGATPSRSLLSSRPMLLHVCWVC